MSDFKFDDLASVIKFQTGTSVEDLRAIVFEEVEGEEPKLKDNWQDGVNDLLLSSHTSKLESEKKEWESAYKSSAPLSRDDYYKQKAEKLGIEVGDNFDYDKVSGEVFKKRASQWAKKQGLRTKEDFETELGKKLEEREVTQNDVERHEFFTSTVNTIKSKFGEKEKAYQSQIEELTGKLNAKNQKDRADLIMKKAVKLVTMGAQKLKPVVAEGKENILEQRINDSALELLTKFDLSTEEEDYKLYKKGSGKDGALILAKDQMQNPLDNISVVQGFFKNRHDAFEDSSHRPPSTKPTDTPPTDDKKDTVIEGSDEDIIKSQFGKMPTTYEEWNDIRKKCGANVKLSQVVLRWGQNNRPKIPRS